MVFTQHESERGGEKKRATRVEVYPKVGDTADQRADLGVGTHVVHVPYHNIVSCLKLDPIPNVNVTSFFQSDKRHLNSDLFWKGRVA